MNSGMMQKADKIVDEEAPFSTETACDPLCCSIVNTVALPNELIAEPNAWFTDARQRISACASAKSVVHGILIPPPKDI